MSKRVYCNRHRADHVTRCPRCIEESWAALQEKMEAALDVVDKAPQHSHGPMLTREYCPLCNAIARFEEVCNEGE